MVGARIVIVLLGMLVWAADVSAQSDAPAAPPSGATAPASSAPAPPASAPEATGGSTAATTASTTATPVNTAATAASSAATTVSAGEVAVLTPPRVEYQRRYNLLIGGGGLMLSTWTADRLLARDLSNSWVPWLPLAGPWFLFWEQSQRATPSTAVRFLLVVDGLLQAGGLTMTVLGLVLHKKRIVISLRPTSSPTSR